MQEVAQLSQFDEELYKVCTAVRMFIHVVTWPLKSKFVRGAE